MASLTGSKVSDTYQQLLKLTSQGVGADASAKYVEDGLGTDTALSLSTTRAGIGTDSPDGLLHAKVTTNTSETIRLQNDDTLSTLGVSSDGYSFLTYQNALHIVPWDGSTWGGTKVLVDANGNVGIGNAVASTINSANNGGRLVIGDGSGNEGMTIYSGNGSGEYGILYFADGTSGASTYQGWLAYLQDVNALTFATSGSEKMRIDSSGNVGIGTLSVDTKLHLKDTGGIEVRLEADSNNAGQEDCFIRFYTDGKTQEGIVGMDNNNSSTLFSGNTENAMVFGCVSNLPVVFATNNTERMQITSGGNIGIGESSPLATVHIKQADSGASVHGSADQLAIENSSNAGISILSGTSGEGAIYFGDSGDNDIGRIRYNHDGNSMDFKTNTSVKMGINSSGFVGIGDTTSANALLDINKSTTSDTAPTGDESYEGYRLILANPQLTNYATNALGFSMYNGEVCASIDASTLYNGNYETTLRFQTRKDGSGGLTSKMTIDPDGRIIAGGGSAEGTHSERLGVKCLSRYGIFVSDNMSSGTTTIMRMYDTNATTVVGSITSTSSGTAYNTSSDYRLKENEVVISDGLTRLNRLKPYRFNFKTDTDTTVDGFFAHEVSEVVPEAITGEKDAVDDDGNIISQGIDQSKLVPLLVKAVQELSSINDELKARIEELEPTEQNDGPVNSVKERVNSLEARVNDLENG